MQVSAPAPQFTSVPVTAALQDVLYTYTLAATDPAGGTVSFALTTAPPGVALNGNTITWTPAASQSRVSNSFTVTATTPSGGRATQAWTVSPNGTVTINWVYTYWTPTGQVQVPVNSSAGLSVSAVVPQPDGSLTVLKGSATSAGVFSITNVPAGYYWLTFGNVNLVAPQFAAAYWTSTSTFDAGRDVAGSPAPLLSSPAATTFNFNLSGLDSTAAPTSVEFEAAGSFLAPFLSDPANSPILSETFGYASNIDWSQVSSAFFMQYEPESLGSLNNLVLGPELTASSLALTNGVNNTITATLQPSLQAALSLSVSGSQWAPLFAGAGPGTATPYSSALAVYAEPYVSGRNALSPGLGSTVVLASTALGGSSFGFGFQPFGGCDGLGFPVVSIASQPAIVTDQNFGTLQYGDPFPATWTRALSICQEATIPIAIPNSTTTANFSLVDGESVAPSNSPLAPLVFAVQIPTINGSSIFSANTINTTSPTLSWSAPTGSKPFGYRVATFVQTTFFNGAQGYQPAGAYFTAKTSITLPPLSGGNTYVFAITAEVDGAANMETSPYRSSLPNGFASVVSAPVTISSGASAPTIHGDARVVAGLSQPTGHSLLPTR